MFEIVWKCSKFYKTSNENNCQNFKIQKLNTENDYKKKFKYIDQKVNVIGLNLFSYQKKKKVWTCSPVY
jgi:hypothetical protein